MEDHRLTGREENDLLDRDEILLRATDLGKLLAKCEEVQQFQAAEAALLSHPQAYQLMDELRRTQVQLQELQESGDADKLAELDVRIAEIMDKLEEIPEVQAFERAQDVVNGLLGTVSQILAESVTRYAGLHQGQIGI